jgi:hypothetical protein
MLHQHALILDDILSDNFIKIEFGKLKTTKNPKIECILIIGRLNQNDTTLSLYWTPIISFIPEIEGAKKYSPPSAMTQRSSFHFSVTLGSSNLGMLIKFDSSSFSAH